MDAHALVSALKDLSAELGYVPTRREFEARVKGGAYQLTRLFGSFSALLHAAGLERKPDRRPKGNEIFERDLAERLEQYQPAPVVTPVPLKRTIIIPDTHFPFHNPRVLEAAYRFAEKEKPARIVQVGDLYDMYSYSKFPRSLNVYLPKQEEELGRKAAAEMWTELQKASPGAECVQLKGNHDIRPLKRTLESLPSIEHVVSKYLDELMTFPGVNLIVDERQEYLADGILYLHGYKSGLGQHRDHSIMSVVCGHIHVGGVVYKRIRGQTLFELNCGLAGDPESKALSYTPQKITHWTPGFGFIDEYGPRFIPV